MSYKLRIKRTQKLMDRFVEKQPILDLGGGNKMRDSLKGFTLFGTGSQDLDEDSIVYDCPTTTAFEILEHLVNPYSVLKNLQSEMLIATVPLNVWFSSAYWGGEWDRHYHEFYTKQFDMLLEKAGWKIIHREKWKYDRLVLGVRPILRLIYPSWYAVVAIREV